MEARLLELEEKNIDLIREAEILKVLVNNACHSSTESFKGIVLSIWNKVIGLIGGILLQFRKITRIFNTLKQTELEEFEYRNSVFLSRLKRANYNDLKDIKIPYPEGMVTTYFDCVSKVCICLESFNMLDKSKSFLNICETIHNGVVRKNFRKDMPELQVQIESVDNIKKLFTDYTKCFTNKKERDKPFGKLFLNMQEYTSVKDLLDKNDKHQFQVKAIYKNIEECNDITKKSIKAISDDKEVQDSLSKEDLISMSNACMFFAKTVDMYGSTIMDYHGIEHNFVEVLKLLKKENVFR